MKKRIIFLSILCLALFVFTAASCSVSTAKLSQPTLSSKIDPNTKEAISPTTVFAKDTPKIYCSFKISNAPSGTKAKAVWTYTKKGEEQEIDSSSLDVGGAPSGAFNLSKPTAGWPTGPYKVDLYLDNKLVDTVTFTVK